MEKMNLDDLTHEIGVIIKYLEIVQDLVLDGDIEAAEKLYKQSLGHARRFGMSKKLKPFSIRF